MYPCSPNLIVLFSSVPYSNPTGVELTWYSLLIFQIIFSAARLFHSMNYTASKNSLSHFYLKNSHWQNYSKKHSDWAQKNRFVLARTLSKIIHTNVHVNFSMCTVFLSACNFQNIKSPSCPPPFDRIFIFCKITKKKKKQCVTKSKTRKRVSGLHCSIFQPVVRIYFFTLFSYFFYVPRPVRTMRSWISTTSCPLYL